MDKPRIAIWVNPGQSATGMDYGTALETVLHAHFETIRVRADAWAHTDHTAMAVAAHLITGGETNTIAPRAREDESRLSVLAEIVAAAHAGGPGVFGICAGAQMLAHLALPGAVRVAECMEAGMQIVHGPTGPEKVAQFHYHQIDQTLGTVPGITLTHTNTHSPVQGFRWGTRVAGVQFHPEWGPLSMARVLADQQALARRYGAHLWARYTEPGPVWDPEATLRLVKSVTAAPVVSHEQSAA